MNNYKEFKAIRKPIAPPTKVFNSKNFLEDTFEIDEGINEYLEDKNREKQKEKLGDIF